MVYLSGSEISSGFTYGSSVVTIYTYGCQVWPVEQPWNGSGIGPEAKYYISWRPSNLSGSFTMNGSTYHLEDYNGYFSDFDGVIPSECFKSVAFTKIETNAYSIGSLAFNNCSSLSILSLSECRYIGVSAFRNLPSLTLTLPKCSCLDDSAFRIGVSWSSRISGCVFSCSSYGSYCFLGRYLMEDPDFTNCTYVGDQAFYGAIGMRTDYPIYDFPNCSYIGNGAFHGCGMVRVKLSKVTHIGQMAFFYDDSWDVNPTRHIYIYTSTVCEFYDATFSCVRSESWYTGWDIYVPSSLVTAYKTQYPAISGRIYSIPNN